MAEEKDYTRLNEDQLKEELRKLEERILKTTGDPIGSQYRKFYRWASNKNAVEKVGLMMSERSYILELLFEKHCTPSEVARLEKVNDLLREMTDRTYKRTASLFRNALSLPQEELDDNLVIMGKLIPEYDLPSSVLRLEDDEYYGSDFIRMAAILQETEEFQPGMTDVSCYARQVENYHSEMSDKELGCFNYLDSDIDNWAEGWLAIPSLKHIRFCYATHALVSHMNWSIPDVLRINNYKIEVTVSVQQYSDQDRNRIWWWNKCDLQHFKQILLKEAESRPSGLPLKDFILQRARDYFEELADESLAEASISNLDLYLLTVFNKVNRIV